MDKTNTELALNVVPLTEQVSYLTEAILAGYVSPLEGSLALKQIANLVSKAQADIKDVAIEEAEKYGREGFNNAIGKIEERNSASRYSYKHLPDWVAVKSHLTDIENQAKEAQKASEKGLTISDYDGEIVEPAIKSGGGETLFVSLKK